LIALLFNDTIRPIVRLGFKEIYVIDQEFSKRGPSQGSGTKQNEENSEAKCEISVRVQFLTFFCTKFRI